jgi:hypothetical protein
MSEHGGHSRNIDAALKKPGGCYVLHVTQSGRAELHVTGEAIERIADYAEG